MDNKAKRAKEYQSFEKLREDRVKHKRMDNELVDKYKAPLTFGQSVGFLSKDPRQQEISQDLKRPKNKCNETKYAMR